MNGCALGQRYAPVDSRASVEGYIRHCREQWVTGGPLRSFRHQTKLPKHNTGTIDLVFRRRGGCAWKWAGQRCLRALPQLARAWTSPPSRSRSGVPVCVAEHGATEAVIKVEPENSASARWRCGRACAADLQQDGTVFAPVRTCPKGKDARR